LPKSVPTHGSPHIACPSISPIIDESQVLPVLPDPKIQTMFSGFMPFVSVPFVTGRARSSANIRSLLSSSWRASSSCRLRSARIGKGALPPRVTPASRFRNALMLRTIIVRCCSSAGT
jgi:hypothetical protein